MGKREGLREDGEEKGERRNERGEGREERVEKRETDHVLILQCGRVLLFAYPTFFRGMF